MARGFCELVKNISFGLLLIEFGLCVTGCVMVSDLNMKYLDHHSQDVIVLTVGIYTIITALLLIELIFEENVDIHELLYILLLMPGGILNIVSGVLCILKYQQKTSDDVKLLTLLVTTFCCGFLMIMDVIVTVKRFFDNDEVWIL